MVKSGPENASFPPEEFDQWAETYDQDVLDENSFPFQGYTRVLDTVVELAEVQPGMRVLDVGTGTANLAQRFAQLGCELWCSDFSSQMLDRARRKLPEAHFVHADLRGEWPAALIRPFERIVSAYVFHHFPMHEKKALVSRLVRRLVPGGAVLIADIAFNNSTNQDAQRLAAGDAWDDEYYWIADEVIHFFTNAGLRVGFHPVSPCSGVFLIQPA